MTTDSREAEYLKGRLYVLESLLFALYNSLLFKDMSTEEKEKFLELIDEMTKADRDDTLFAGSSLDFSKGVVQGYYKWKKRMNRQFETNSQKVQQL